jgi:hypothetical protein
MQGLDELPPLDLNTNTFDPNGDENVFNIARQIFCEVKTNLSLSNVVWQFAEYI